MINFLLAWHWTRMDELAGCEVLEFLWSGLPAQDFVAVRVTAEAGDDVTMTTGLVRGELEYAAMLLWRLFDKFRCEIDRSFQICETLGMSKGQEKESFFPGGLEGCIMTVLDAFESEAESLRILRERLSASAMDRARELIENNDKRQPRPRTLRPAVELAPLGLIQ